MKTLLRHTLILLALSLLLGACGYTVGDKHTVLAPEYRTLAIGTVDNPTVISWLEPRLRKLVKDELTRRGEVTWVDDQARADALISIDIDRYYRPTAVTGSDDQTLRQSAIFDFSATIKSTTDGSTLWSSGSIRTEWPFYSGQEAEADAEVTRLGIRRMADRITQNY